MDEISLVRYLIGASMTKYDVLMELFSDQPVMDYRMCVMYVDAHAIFHRLFREKNIGRVFGSDENYLVRDLVIGFMNVIGHYRRFMSRRLHMDNDIYVFFNVTPSKYHTDRFRDFNEKLYGRYDDTDPDYGSVAKVIQQAWKFILSLSPYFTGIYCIDNQEIDDFAAMQHFGFQKDIYYIIFSRNMYATQMINKNVVQLVNRRDSTYLLTRKNCYRDGVLRKLKYKPSDNLRPDMLPLFWTLSGLSDVSVPRMKGVSGIVQVLKICEKEQNADWMNMYPISLEAFLRSTIDRFENIRMFLRTSKDTLESRYSVLSIPIASKAINSNQEIKLASYCYDIDDDSYIEGINQLLVSKDLNSEIIDMENLNMSYGY